MRRSQNAGRRLLAGLLLALCASLAAAPASEAALVICKRRKRIQLREDACKRKETRIDATELGVPGVPGQDGAAGAPGSPGQDGAAGVGGSFGKASVSTGVTAFVAPNQTSSTSATEPGAQALTPNVALKLSEFAAQTTAAPTGGAFTLTVRVDGADTVVSCAVAVSTTTCTSAGEVTIPARSLVSIRLQNASSATVAVTWSFTLTPA
jgi:hypothetical protein